MEPETEARFAAIEGKMSEFGSKLAANAKAIESRTSDWLGDALKPYSQKACVNIGFWFGAIIWMPLTYLVMWLLK